MEREILQNIWNFLTSNGMTNTPFEEWVVNIQNSDAIQKNIHSYLIEQNVVVNDFDTWANNLGLKKKSRVRNRTRTRSRSRYGFTYGGWFIGIIKNTNIT